jgi:hypothetical protein
MIFGALCHWESRFAALPEQTRCAPASSKYSRNIYSPQHMKRHSSWHLRRGFNGIADCGIRSPQRIEKPNEPAPLSPPAPAGFFSPSVFFACVRTMRTQSVIVVGPRGRACARVGEPLPTEYTKCTRFFPPMQATFQGDPLHSRAI